MKLVSCCWGYFTKPQKIGKYGVQSTVFPLLSQRKLQFILGQPIEYIKQVAGKAGKHYHPFDIAKKNSDQWRHIDNPDSALKDIQYKIKARLLDDVQLPNQIMGGVKGKSIKECAAYHIDQPCLVSLDLKNCYPRINNQRIYDIFRRIFGCSSDIASILTKLTTFQTRLPHGSPTSSMLANFALLPIYNDVMLLTRDKDVNITFYVDDITISGNDARLLMSDVINIIQKHGFAVRRKKTKVMAAHERQGMLGLITNSKLSKPSEYIEKIRKDILNCRDLVITKNLYLNISGRINHIRYIDKVRGDTLSEYFHKIVPSYSEDCIYDLSKHKTRRCKNAKRHREYV